MTTESKVTEFFVMANDFCIFLKNHSIPDNNKRKYHSNKTMSKTLIRFVCEFGYLIIIVDDVKELFVGVSVPR